jgi:hypothetical protein
MARVTPTEVISNWSHLIEFFNYSSKDFYTQVEEAVKKREIPDIKFQRVDFKEGGMLSAKREYLRVRRHALVFDICAAPFGKGFFVSWWLGEPMGCFEKLALIPIFSFLSKPATYYSLDNAAMFRTSIHGAVTDVIDEITKDVQGVKQLTEADKKPIMHEFYRR